MWSMANTSSMAMIAFTSLRLCVYFVLPSFVVPYCREFALLIHVELLSPDHLFCAEVCLNLSIVFCTILHLRQVFLFFDYTHIVFLLHQNHKSNKFSNHFFMTNLHSKRMIVVRTFEVYRTGSGFPASFFFIILVP